MMNGEDSMTRLQSPIAGAAVCVLMACAAAALGQEASAVQQTAAEKDAPCLRSSADPSCAAAVPSPCPPRPLPLARPSLPLAARVEHLLQAALHLEAAGEAQRAAEVRKLAASEGQCTPGCTAWNESVASALSSPPGAQQVLVKLKVCELSRSRMKELGLEFPAGSGANAAATPVAAAPAGRSPWLVERKNVVLEMLDRFQEKGLLRVLAEPTIVTVSGRPTSFHSGGQVQVARPAPDGSATLEIADVGTRVDLVAVVTAPESLQLELRMQVSQADQSHSLKVGDILAPTVRLRSVSTRADIRSGQALLLGGLVQQTAKPAGPAIAANEPAKAAEEVELFFLIMPEIVDGAGIARASSAKAE